MNASPHTQVFQLRCTGSFYLDKQFCWQIPGAAIDGLILFREAKPFCKTEYTQDSVYSAYLNRLAEMRRKVIMLKDTANKQ